MRYIVLFLSFLLSNAVYCQVDIQWQKTMGGSSYEEGESIIQSVDGGFVIVGSTVSTNGDVFGNHGGGDTWVIKTNWNGDVLWKRVYGGSQNDIPYKILQTMDNGYIIVGYTSSNDFNVSGQTDGWVLKLNSNGNLEWQKTIGGSKSDYFSDIAVTNEGGFILAGYSNSLDGDLHENHGGIDSWVVKLDSIGDIVWSKTFGGSEDDFGRCITGDGERFVIGSETLSTDGDISYNHGNGDYWLVQLDTSGLMLWEKSYGGQYVESPNEIQCSSDGGYIVIGITGSHNSGQVSGHEQLGLFDYWLVKTDSTGELQWQLALGGSDPDYGMSIVQLSDGGYLAAGTTQSSNGDVTGPTYSQDVWLVKINAFGVILWQKKFGGSLSEECNSIITTSDGSLAFTGFSWSTDGDLSGNFNKGFNDLWIVKLSPESVSANEPPGDSEENIFLYPNPTSESVYLQMPAWQGLVHVRVFDFSGRKVLEQELPDDNQIKTENLPNGIYSVNVTTATGRSWSSTLLIRHEE